MAITTESVRRSFKKPIERVACRAFLSADQDNLTSSAWVKVLLASVTYDLGSNFDITTNNRFIVPVSGLYHVTGKVYFTAASVQADKNYFVAIYKNGVAVVQANTHASYVEALSVEVNDEIYLEETNYIELYTQTTGTGDSVDVDGDANGLRTSMVIRLITKEGIRQ